MNIKKYVQEIAGDAGSLSFGTRSGTQVHLSRRIEYTVAEVRSPGGYWLCPSRELTWHYAGRIRTDEHWDGFSQWVEENGGISLVDSTCVRREWSGISAFMRDLAHYCAIRVNTPVYELKVSATRSGAEVVIEHYDATPILLTLRELRAWLGRMEKIAAKTQQRPVTPVLEWLTANAEEGIMEVDISGQEVPLSVRTSGVETDWRYVVNDEHIDERVQRELATAGDTIGKQLFSSGSNWRAKCNLISVARYTGHESSVFIDVTQEFGWVRGMFGDPNSCWWEGYNEARSIMYHGGGFAVRLWGDASGKDGRGRFWVAPTGNGDEVVIFNAYGHEWDLHQGAALLEHITGQPLAKCEVVDEPAQMYINDSTHYRFGSEPFEQYDEVSVSKTMQRLNYRNRGLVWHENSDSWSTYRQNKLYSEYYTPPFEPAQEEEEDTCDVYCDFCDEWVEGPIEDHNRYEHGVYNSYWCRSCHSWHEN